MKIRAYKVFNPDWTCCPPNSNIKFQYEIGKTYINKDKLEMCANGFHACIQVQNCFSYYKFNPNNKVAEVELSGTILGIDEEKQCASKIKIIKEISWEEMLKLANTGIGNSGYSNSGYSNSGDSNSGHRNSGSSNSGSSNSGHRNSGSSNSGHRNSGDRNSGHSNSGHWNSVNFETGMFNSIESDFIRVFNRKCLRQIWENCKKPNFIYFNLTEWISFDQMNDEEKINYPKAYICDGYLKIYTYKEAWTQSFKTASKEDIELLKLLPNFDAKVFEEISGIKIV